MALSLALIAASQPTEAKCASKRFHLIISAYDGETNLSVSGVTIVLFANAESEAWLPDYANVEPIVTGTNGSVSGTFYFNPSSGSFFGIDSCHGKLKQLEVVATRAGYRPARVTVKVAAAVTSSTPTEVTLRIPAIMLQPVK